MKKVKSIIFGMIAGANVVTIIVMLMLGFADHINPVSHPSISGLGMFFPFAALANLFFLFLWLTIKWRMAWIPFVGFLLAYAPMRTYMPFNLPSSPPKDAIKIISYNIAGYASAADSADGFKLITEYIREQKPDIFCTQEDNDTKPRTDEFYESTFPYNDTYKINESDKVINRVGIHTRYPILRTERIGDDPLMLMIDRRAVGGDHIIHAADREDLPRHGAERSAAGDGDFDPALGGFFERPSDDR